MKFPIMGRWLSGGGREPPGAKVHVAFDQSDKPRFPVNRARRDDGPDLSRNVSKCLQLTKRTLGADALITVERYFDAVYAIDSHVTNGGFDGWLANVTDPNELALTVAGLEAVRQPDAAGIAKEAVLDYYQNPLDMDGGPEADAAFLARMHAFDARWNALGIDFDRLLHDFVDEFYPWAD